MPDVGTLAANFERQMGGRVVMTGHGSYRSSDRWIVVPQGKRIHFYCPHGQPLSNSVGMAVEGFQAGQPPQPYQTVSGGARLPNYILSYPGDLTLNGTKKNAKYDWISIRHRGQAVHLSVLLRDLRCIRATDIHWAACRSRADWLGADTHNAGYVLGPAHFAK